MKLDLSNKLDINRFKSYSNKLIEQGKKVELKELKNTRSLRQNAFLHVCISLFAIEFGYNLDEAKTHLKRECNFMKYQKGEEWFLKRTRDMKSDELAKFIDWIRDYAGTNGCYMPDADEYLANKFSIDKEIERNESYL